jgi:integrase
MSRKKESKRIVDPYKIWFFNGTFYLIGLCHVRNEIRIHDLRHSYASILIRNRESLAYVRDQLGHHSIKVTVDIYGHLAPEGNKDAVDKLDDPVLSDGKSGTLLAPKIKKELQVNAAPLSLHQEGKS